MVEYRIAQKQADRSIEFGELGPVTENDDQSEEIEGESYDEDQFEEDELQEELKRTALEFAHKLTELEIHNNQMLAQGPFIKEEDQVEEIESKLSGAISGKNHSRSSVSKKSKLEINPKSDRIDLQPSFESPKDERLRQ